MDSRNIDNDFVKGEEVWIRDYPMGRRLNVRGKIVGVLDDNIYSVLLLSGLQEGKIRKFKFWSLMYKENDE